MIKDANVSIGQGERTTDLLVFGSLQNCSNYNFYKELEVFGHNLLVTAYLRKDHDHELQTDGNCMEEVKDMLMFTMLLAKMVINHTPFLLCDVFLTTVKFINQNLVTYMRNLEMRWTEWMTAKACLVKTCYGDSRIAASNGDGTMTV
ncbi:BH3-interacting domain death agonist-like [Glossophaga mutica]